MRLREVVLPPILLLITFVQVSSFAFGPSIQWSEKVKESASTTQHLVLLDYEIVAVDKNFIFWVYAIGANVAMFVFLFAEITGMYEKFDEMERFVQDTKGYRDEEKDDGVCQPNHLVKAFLNVCQTGLGLCIYAASTFLIAPLAKVCAKMFDCVEHEGQEVLMSNPHMECWSAESGHKQIALLTAVLFPLFLLGLAPYVVVVGDPSYVQQAELLNPRDWVENWSASAARKATVLNQGPWHPNPRYIFRNNMVEFMAKASIPFISVLLTERPKFQMAMLSLIGLGMFVTTTVWAPRTEPVCSVLVFGLRLFTFLMMLIGFTVTLLNDPGCPYPLWALEFVSVIVPVWTIWRIYVNAQMKVKVTWKSTAVDAPRTPSESRPLLRVDG